MANAEAPEGYVYVCGACGKRSQDRYGNKKISHGWDESCMMHSFLVRKDLLVVENGLVVRVKDELPKRHLSIVP